MAPKKGGHRPGNVIDKTIQKHQMSHLSHRALADLDGTWGSRESRQAGFESRNLTPSSSTASVDSGHPELVSRSWLKFHLFRQAFVAFDVNLGLLQVSVGQVVAGDGAGGALDDPHVKPVGLSLPLLGTHFVKLIFHEGPCCGQGERGGRRELLIFLLHRETWQGWGGGLLGG